MIKGIITDIDGVLVGEKIGYNSPDPHPDVMVALLSLSTKGMPVILCTGKPHYAIQNIIKHAHLSFPHVTDGGAIVIDPISNTIVKQHIIPPAATSAVLKTYLEADMYIELYTSSGYVIQQNQQREPLTRLHTHVLQTAPLLVPDLITYAQTADVIKLMPIATDEHDAERLKSLFMPFSDRLTLSMGVHPIANPHQFGLITNAGVSKRQSAIDAASTTGIPLSDFLGIGDSTSDWSFMELCGYTATVGNGSQALKDKATYVGGSVDENGALDILRYFSLIPA